VSVADFDLFVIGGGSGGVACARRAASHGARVGLAESSRMGGTCVIRGCVPKKLMHYGAHFGELFKAARAYGWQAEGLRHEFRALLLARNKEIARLNGIYIQMLQKAGVRIFDGHARLLGRDADGTFRIDAAGQEVTATRVLIAVGARPSLPELPGIEHAVTSDFILEEVFERPRRLAVIGAGYIGIELASAMSGLGVETHLIFRRDLPLAGFDEDIRTEMMGQIAQKGIVLHASTRVDRIERTMTGGVVLDTTGGPLEADMVLYATGRAPTPNTQGVGLELVGCRMDEGGAILVDSDYRSCVEGLFAVGDCSDHAGNGLDTGSNDLTPVAIAEGRAVAERVFNNRSCPVAYETIPTAVFGLPQAATVGLTEVRALELGHEIDIYRTRFRPMIETLPEGEERVMMKLLVDKRTDKVIGCHMVGADAAEIIQSFAVALTAGATKAEVDATVALHPTVAEELVTMYQPVS
jgi:glutathione reductase (NADPH)